MKILTCKQNTPEWHRARLGIPTASNFDRIVTPAKLERSTQAKSYRYELLSEWLTGIPHGADAPTQFMQRGTMLEPQAASWYEMTRGVDVREVGFVQRDDGLVGCSPDRLVGEDGGLEIKCPAASTHVRYLVEGLTGYTAQVQGSLWISGRKWWDLLAFNPDLPPIVVRIERDERYIAALAQAVDEFVADLLRDRELLESRGCVPSGLQLTPRTADPEPF